MRRAVVGYDDLLADWQAALGAAERPLGLDLVTGRRSDELTTAGALVDSSLRRAAADWSALGLAPPVRDLAERAYAALSDPDRTATLDAVRADYAELYTWAADLSRSRVRAARVEERRKVRAENRVSGGPPTP
jgi:hypothetical protein